MKAIALACLAAAACSNSAPKVGWITDEAAAYDRARKQDKLVLVDFAVTWAVQSEVLDRHLASPEVASVIDARYIPVRLDVSNETDSDDAVQKRYGVVTLPQLVITDNRGVVRGRIDRAVEAPELRAMLERL